MSNLFIPLAIEVDPEIMGGFPVVKGTRFTLAQFLAELSASDSVLAIAQDFDLPYQNLRSVLDSLAEHYHQRVIK